MLEGFTAGDNAILAALLAAGLLLLVASQFIRVPYPILLVLGGLAIAFIPGMPTVQLAPNLVLVAVLPPLLYGSAFFTSLRELRASLKPILLLAIGLVLITMVAVAVAVHAVIPGLRLVRSLRARRARVADGSHRRHLDRAAAGPPRRLITVIEGESLVNDGTALVALKFAVAAVVTGTFSLAEATGEFALNVVGGIAVGLAVGYLIRQLRRRVDNPPVEITISLLSGYFGYLPARALGVSGVIAAVTVGIYMGWHTPELTNAQVRLQGVAVWEVVFLILNALLFALIGLQLPSIVDALSAHTTMQLIGYAALVSAVVIAARFAWVFSSGFVGHAVSRRFRREDPAASWASKTVLSWSGMRGAVSLAAALALPLTVDSGASFPNRNLIIFLTFSVILVTLVLQGLTLPGLIRVLDLEDDGLAEKEEAKARIYAAQAAIDRLGELEGEEWVRDDTAERLRGLYGFRQNRFRERFDPDGDGTIEDRSQAYQRLLRELIDAERRAVEDLRREGRIDDNVMRRVIRDLDLEESRLDL
jgi:CPA1 family monovalent cation:H+ antiporter